MRHVNVCLIRETLWPEPNKNFHVLNVRENVTDQRMSTQSPPFINQKKMKKNSSPFLMRGGCNTVACKVPFSPQANSVKLEKIPWPYPRCTACNERFYTGCHIRVSLVIKDALFIRNCPNLRLILSRFCQLSLTNCLYKIWHKTCTNCVWFAIHWLWTCKLDHFLEYWTTIIAHSLIVHSFAGA